MVRLLDVSCLQLSSEPSQNIPRGKSLPGRKHSGILKDYCLKYDDVGLPSRNQLSSLYLLLYTHHGGVRKVQEGSQ
ncbi:unnamed protein product [Timema podura]|uniref:Uncharacterized protein n=1 Tax=Timema podura TaxID=61482 RepID=A0ABN7PL27_TIMPD|nr:unnamed protein product [Timema podura]